MTTFTDIDSLLGISVTIALVLLAVALIAVFIRLLQGPSLADRVLALDMFAILAMGFIGLRVIATGKALFLEIAIALGLVSFLATVFFARLIETRGHELHHGYDMAKDEKRKQAREEF